MSRNYEFHNPEGLYFISFAVAGWLDVFIRNEYKDIFSKNQRFFRQDWFSIDYPYEKGLLDNIVVFRMFISKNDHTKGFVWQLGKTLRY